MTAYSQAVSARWAFDGEGVPHQKTAVIEKGVLRSFLYDNYSAKKEGKESTGNAARAGYLSTPKHRHHKLPRYCRETKQPNEMLSESR